ncbi:hypothetical protein FHS42_005227 [Streptomyces zagrosensis]|uniref:Uncharacterized protein n=1 Tax=Streptomyces zagrosensis TaxID=1042984 RepID=A0A7W9QEB3_9ACTN|nr:hypothetical protein [Streptomyces zagrosensis]
MPNLIHPLATPTLPPPGTHHPNHPPHRNTPTPPTPATPPQVAPAPRTGSHRSPTHPDPNPTVINL